MLNLTTICLIVLSTLFTCNCVDLEKASLSRHLTITLPKSTTVACGDNRKGSNVLYTVSLSKSNVHINSSDSSHRTCDMSIDSNKDTIQGEMNVLVTNKYMYIVGEHAIEKHDDKDKTKYVLLIIKLDDCTLKSADVPLAQQTFNSLPQMVERSQGVDLFFPKMDTCAPCQFNNNGVKEETGITQLTPPKPNDDGMPQSYHVTQNAGFNYVYVENIDSNKANIKILEEKTMKLLKSKQIELSVNTLTKTNDVLGNFGICSKKYDNMLADITAFKEINCQAMDKNLDVKSSIKITIEPYSRPISSVSYDADKTGTNTYIGFAVDQDLRVYVHDHDGKIVKAFDMGKIDERFEKYKHQPMFYSPYSHWDVRGFIVDEEYCLVTEQISDYDEHEIDLHDVRCIQLVK